MDRDALTSRLATAFSPQVRAAIVEAVQAAYYDASERFDQGLGCNGATFGTDVYNFACHQLERVAESFEEECELVSRFPAFRLRVGPYGVACHRVGASDSDPITRSFPSSTFAGATLASPQLCLFGGDEERAEIGVVIAHQGSPERGLCAVYLCLPDSVNSNGRIDHWGHIELLWKLGDEAEVETPVEVTLPPVEEVAVPVVTRKRDKGGQA